MATKFAWQYLDIVSYSCTKINQIKPWWRPAHICWSKSNNDCQCKAKYLHQNHFFLCVIKLLISIFKLMSFSEAACEGWSRAAGNLLLPAAAATASKTWQIHCSCWITADVEGNHQKPCNVDHLGHLSGYIQTHITRETIQCSAALYSLLQRWLVFSMFSYIAQPVGCYLFQPELYTGHGSHFWGQTGSQTIYSIILTLIYGHLDCFWQATGVLCSTVYMPKTNVGQKIKTEQKILEHL